MGLERQAKGMEKDWASQLGMEPLFLESVLATALSLLGLVTATAP